MRKSWAYLYRAVDSAGDTIDFMLSPKRDLTAAKLFLRFAFLATGSADGSARVWNLDLGAKEALLRELSSYWNDPAHFNANAASILRRLPAQ